MRGFFEKEARRRFAGNNWRQGEEYVVRRP